VTDFTVIPEKTAAQVRSNVGDSKWFAAITDGAATILSKKRLQPTTAQQKSLKAQGLRMRVRRADLSPVPAEGFYIWAEQDDRAPAEQEPDPRTEDLDSDPDIEDDRPF
jgi:hypothetical protein